MKRILIANWFMKVAQNNINNEILLFSTTKSIAFITIKNSIDSIIEATPKQYSIPYPFNTRSKYNKQYTPTENEKKVLEYQYVSGYGYTIYLMDSHNINIINEIKNYKNKNKNIIIVTINNYAYTDYTRSFLYLNIDNETNNRDGFIDRHYIGNLQKIISDNINAPDITHSERYQHYIEFFPIVKILKSTKFDVLKEFINFNLTPTQLSQTQLDILLQDTSYHKNKFALKDLIDADMYLLQIHRILTSRLAMVLYRLSFLNHSINKTKIGLFFKKELNVKSTTINLNNLNVEFINEDLSNKSFRGYNLKNPILTDYTTRVEIAKKLLKAGVDIKIITKATKLAQSKIL